jgi:hypothetical protein
LSLLSDGVNFSGVVITSGLAVDRSVPGLLAPGCAVPIALLFQSLATSFLVTAATTSGCAGCADDGGPLMASTFSWGFGRAGAATIVSLGDTASLGSLVLLRPANQFPIRSRSDGESLTTVFPWQAGVHCCVTICVEPSASGMGLPAPTSLQPDVHDCELPTITPAPPT